MSEPAMPWIPLPASGDVHEVLAVGDSICGSCCWALGQTQWWPDVVLRDEHRNGSGLLTPIFQDAQHPAVEPVEFVDNMLARWPDADTVLVGWEGACRTPCPLPYGSPEWYAEWWTEVGEVERLIRDDGRTIVWGIAPPAPPQASPPDGQYQYSQAVSDTLSWQGRTAIDTPRADWWQASCAADGFLGHYAQHLDYAPPWPGPVQTHQVRGPDMVHFTEDGAFRQAWWTVATFRTLWAAT